MSRWRLPKIESSDAARALELAAELADRAAAGRTARTRSTRPERHGERVDDRAEDDSTP